MRLDSISIAGFRGFRDQVDLALDADVIILTGPNGSGKTSFFDAIQWLLLGEVPRLRAFDISKRESGVEHVRNRYSATLPLVSARFRDTHDMHWAVTRRGDGELAVKGEGENGFDAQNWVRRAIGARAGDVRRLLTRAYILQQDDVKEFLAADTKERYEFLSELAGLEELQRFDDLAKKELRQLRAAERERQDRLTAAVDRRNSLRQQEAESREILDRQRASEANALRSVWDALRTLVPELPSDDESAALSAARRRLAEMRQVLSEVAEARAGLDAARARRAELAEQESTAEAMASRIDVLRKEAADVQSRAERLEQQAAELERQRSSLKNLAALAIDHLGDRCPVCDQEYDRDHALLHLRNLLDDSAPATDLRTAAQQARAQLATLGSQMTSFESELGRQLSRQAELEQVKRLEADASVRIETAFSRFPHDAANSSPRSEALQALAAALETAIHQFELEIQGAQEREAGVRRLESLRAAIEAQERVVVEVSAETTRLSQDVASAEGVCRWIGRHATEVTTDVVGAMVPVVNQLYTRLDVHPTFRRFGFRAERRNELGHIRPWVYDDEKDVGGNAAQILSSAQLNALAVCLFLALNLDHRGDLAATWLDDPIQSMDDVNILSFVDVLRGLRRRRQVFISTHEPDLANLLWRKLRPLAETERTMLIEMAEWTEKGPSIRVDVRSFTPTRRKRELLAA